MSKTANNHVLIPTDMPQRGQLESLLRDNGLEPMPYQNQADAERALAAESPVALLLSGKEHTPTQALIVKHVRSSCPDVFILDVGRETHERARTVGDDIDALTDAILSYTSTPEEIALAIRMGETLRDVRNEADELRNRLGKLESRHTEQIHRIDRLQNACIELEEQAANARELSLRDELTKLFNRRHFLQVAEQELERARRDDGQFAIAFIDLDHFKKVNDTFGHPVGDQVLRCLADTLSESVRRMDTVARFGGEEFVILLPRTGQTVFDAGRFTERLRAIVAGRPLGKKRCGEDLYITMSAGVAEYPKDGDSIDALIDTADTRLYRAKTNGRNRVFAKD
jgi:diguanylate cyclase (GGDEF)-like protein